MESIKKEKITIHQIFWYLVIFSIIGLIIETLYAYLTLGIIESRKGLIWGPFCPVYGVGATILIVLLDQIEEKSNIKLFVYGFFIGSMVEYILSYGLEAFYSTRFWDYEYTNLDINGRICVPYSIFWGILAIILMKTIKPFIDKIIFKFGGTVRNKFEIVLFTFLVIDTLATIWGVSTYEARASNHLNGEDVIQNTNSQNIFINLKNKIENEYFTNERMSKIFPNLRIKDANGNEIFIKEVFKQ